MVERCLHCGCQMAGPALSTEMLLIRRCGPWPVEAVRSLHRCPGCLSEHTTVRMNGRDSTWLNEDLVMVAPTHFQPGDKMRLRSPSGSAPLVVAWAYMPLQEEDAAIAMVDQIKADLQIQSQGHESLLVIPASCAAAELHTVRDLFDCCWMLDKSVTADARGPLPSLRAEMSLRCTLSMYGVDVQIHYYWPSLILPANGYQPIADDHRLETWWSRYARRNIPVLVTKE